jgi:hypothetical protein
MEEITSNTGKRPLRNVGTSPALRDGEPAKRGDILAALRRSPLVGDDLKLSRQHENGREVEL